MAISTKSGPYDAHILYGTRVDGVVIPTFSFVGPKDDPEFSAICAWLVETGIRFAYGQHPARNSIILMPRDQDELLPLTLRLPLEIPTPNVIIGEIGTVSLCSSSTPIAASSETK